MIRCLVLFDVQPVATVEDGVGSCDGAGMAAQADNFVHTILVNIPWAIQPYFHWRSESSSVLGGKVPLAQ